MENVNDTNINQEEVKKAIIDKDFKRLAATIGIGAGLYLAGRRSGLKSGYVKGYRRSMIDMLRLAQESK